MSGVRGNSILSELNHFFYSFFAFGLTSIVTLHIFCRILYLTLDGGANLWYDRGAVLFVSEMALIDAAYCNSRFWLPRPRRTRSGTVPSGVRGVHWLCDIPVPGRWRNVRVRQEERAEPTGRSSQFCGGLRFCSERLCRSG